MCQDDRLENFGSCRVCSVEIAREENGASRVVASCHTPVTEGLYIYSHTNKIKKLRKNIVELVLTDYPEDKIQQEEGKKINSFPRYHSTNWYSTQSLSNRRNTPFHRKGWFASLYKVRLIAMHQLLSLC